MGFSEVADLQPCFPYQNVVYYENLLFNLYIRGLVTPESNSLPDKMNLPEILGFP